MNVYTHPVESTVQGIPKRFVQVWVPPGYVENKDTAYPVLYFHDGQNVFAPGGYYGCWYAERSARKAVSEGSVPPFIIAAIDNHGDDRRIEYVPPEDRIKEYPPGRADAYAEFVLNNVMPEINRRYRTLTGPENTAIAGSSLGGVVSLYLAFETGAFGRVCSMSTAMFWAPNFLARLMVRDPLPLRIYHDVGTLENTSMAPANYREVNRELDRVLRGAVVNPEENVKFVIAENEDHNEAAWETRFPTMLPWLWGDYGKT
jgi:predicted alpha/beta superfamily hydrolase